MEGGEDDDSERAALPRQASVRVRLRFRGGVRAGAGKAQLLALESSSGGVCAPSLPGRLPRACNVHPRQINWTFNVGRRSGVGVDRGEEAAAPTLPVKQEGSRLPKRATFSAGERRLPLAASPPPPPALVWLGLAWLAIHTKPLSEAKRAQGVFPNPFLRLVWPPVHPAVTRSVRASWSGDRNASRFVRVRGRKRVWFCNCFERVTHFCARRRAGREGGSSVPACSGWNSFSVIQGRPGPPNKDSPNLLVLSQSF